MWKTATKPVSLQRIIDYFFVETNGKLSGGATPGRPRSNDLTGRSTTLANDLAQ